MPVAKSLSHILDRARPAPADCCCRWGFKCVARGVTFVPLPALMDLESSLAGLAASLCAALIKGTQASSAGRR